MEITKRNRGRVLELHVKGRLDASWADHLGQELLAAIREGRHHIALDFSGLSYISSAGISVLVKFRRQLQGLDGTLSVVNPSETVMEVFRTVRLEGFFLGQPGAGPEPDKKAEQPSAVEMPNAQLDIYPVEATASLHCVALGNPNASSSRGLSLSANGFSIGVGALGADFTDCRARFGEFIGVSNAVAYQPTDRRSVPDYLVSGQDAVSKIHVLYALSCEGRFSHQVNFAAKPGLSVSLLDLARHALDLTRGRTVGMVLVAEVQGLVGAAWKRSPALASPGDNPLGFPQIREWMTFTAEPSFARSVALAAGVVSQGREEALAALLRPLGNDDQPRGHFHAAAFSYRPLRKGQTELGPVVRALFEEERVQGILHLLNDNRPIAGTGQSEFVRGACWLAPISRVVSERT